VEGSCIEGKLDWVKGKISEGNVKLLRSALALLISFGGLLRFGQQEGRVGGLNIGDILSQ
jgi:hypothetical protein